MPVWLSVWAIELSLECYGGCIRKYLPILGAKTPVAQQLGGDGGYVLLHMGYVVDMFIAVSSKDGILYVIQFTSKLSC